LLADLSKTHQVIVVTHLASVAVLAKTHYVVKKTKGDSPETELFEVQGNQRVAEIARMLSGNDSEASMAHAREMLEQAQNS
ncbi:MAG: DNA repair protein RecN, partial [Eggerthellaceae bacterium]|nr:DNA repair protein RecN [Eggerthellaceae bacterium]